MSSYIDASSPHLPLTPASLRQLPHIGPRSSTFVERDADPLWLPSEPAEAVWAEGEGEGEGVYGDRQIPYMHMPSAMQQPYAYAYAPYEAHPPLSSPAAPSSTHAYPPRFPLSLNGSPYLMPLGAPGMGIGNGGGVGDGYMSDNLSLNSGFLPPSDSVHMSSAESFRLYTLFPTRWWVLILCTLLSLTSSLLAVTYVPLRRILATEGASADEQLSPTLLALRSIWTPLLLMPTLLGCLKAASSSQGRAQLLKLAAWCTLLAAVVRLLPQWMVSTALSDYEVYFIHGGQALNAIAVGALVSCVPLVAQTWFSASERRWATALMHGAMRAGACVGFVLGPRIVSSGSKDMASLLYIHLVLAGVCWLFTLLYCPELPPSFPSKEASQMHTLSMVSPTSHRGVLMELRQVLTQPSFTWLLLSTGVVQGVFIGWICSMDAILANYNSMECGWLSASACMGTLVAAWLMSSLSKHRVLPRIKLLLSTLMIGATSAVGAFMCITPSVLDDKPIIQGATFYHLFSCLFVLGLFVGASGSLCFYLGRLLATPVSDSVARCALLMCSALCATLFLFAMPHLNGPQLTLALGTAGVLATLLVLLLSCCSPVDFSSLAEASSRSTGSSRKRSMLERDQEDMQQEFDRIVFGRGPGDRSLSTASSDIFQ